MSTNLIVIDILNNQIYDFNGKKNKEIVQTIETTIPYSDIISQLIVRQ